MAVGAAVLAVIVALSITRTNLSATNLEETASERGTSDESPAYYQVPHDPADMIARIESPQHPAESDLDALTIPELIRRLQVPGVSVAVVWNFDIHWVKSYGVAEVRSGRPVDELTLFQAASISKPVSALAAMQLVEDGSLGLDDGVNSILKSWSVPQTTHPGGQPVTLRSLLSHTSGADDGFGFPGYRPGEPLPDIVQILQGAPPSNTPAVRFARHPFEAYKYSGGSFAVLQAALTDRTGRPFDDLMQTLVLDSLGMSRSTFAQPLPVALHENAARAHGDDGAPMDATWHVYPEQAAAGLWTTASDLARVVVEMQRARRGEGGRILTQASALQMTTPIGDGPFGIGWDVGRNGEGWYFAHGGDNYGFQGLTKGHLRHGYGYAILTNGSNGAALYNEIASRIARAYNWDSTHDPLRR